MEGKLLIMLVVPALAISVLLAGCAPSQTDEIEVQEEQENQSKEFLTEDVTGGEAYINTRVVGGCCQRILWSVAEGRERIRYKDICRKEDL